MDRKSNVRLFPRRSYYLVIITPIIAQFIHLSYSASTVSSNDQTGRVSSGHNSPYHQQQQKTQMSSIVPTHWVKTVNNSGDGENIIVAKSFPDFNRKIRDAFKSSVASDDFGFGTSDNTKGPSLSKGHTSASNNYNVGYGDYTDSYYQIPKEKGGYGNSPSTYHYQIYPSAHSDYGYPTEEDPHKGGLLGLSGLAGLAGLFGLKGFGALGLAKFLLLFAPLLLPIIGPLFLGIIFIFLLPLLLIPIPVVTIPVPGTGGRRVNSLSANARQFVSDKLFEEGQDCVERISCEIFSPLVASNSTVYKDKLAMNLNKFAKDMVGTKNNSKNGKEASLLGRISRGIDHVLTFSETPAPFNNDINSKCLLFTCKSFDSVATATWTFFKYFKK